MRYHVFGAGAGIGKWFALKGLEKAGQVFAYDIDKKAIKNLLADHIVEAKHLDIENAIKGDYLAPVFGNVHSGDWILLAIPESNLPDVCRLISLHVPEDCCVGVMTSKQEGPVAIATEAIPNALVCGLHPLFGPTVPSSHGQVIALCHDGPHRAQFDQLKKTLNVSGLTVEELTPSQHDQSMAYIQALTHFVLLSFAGVIAEADVRLRDLMKIKTPPFQFLSAFSSRLLMANPATYAAIQASDAANSMRKKFLDFAHRLDDEIENGPNKTADMIEQIRAPFSGATLDEFAQFSFMADTAVQARERLYFEVLETSEIVVFRSENLGGFRAGRIVGIDATTVHVEEVLSRVKTPNGTKIPIPFDDVALSAYRAKGINVKISSRIDIKKGKFNLLPRTEAATWLSRNMLMIDSVLSITNPTNLSEEVFEEWVPRFIPEIESCEFIEAFKRRGALPKVKLGLVYGPSTDPRKIEEKLRAFCYNFKPI